MAGPCSVESRKQLLEPPERVARAGATILRGGAYKPRTSPYAFQGLGEDGLKLLAEARERDRAADRHRGDGRPTRSSSSREYADILQIGARNMQNFELLKECAATGKPVLLKRGLSRHDRGVAAGGGVHHGAAATAT